MTPGATRGYQLYTEERTQALPDPRLGLVEIICQGQTFTERTPDGRRIA